MQSKIQAALPSHRKLYYGGGWHESLTGLSEEVFDPATGASLGITAIAGKADVDAAVDAAQAGFREWRQTKLQDRVALLRKAAAIIRANAERITLTDSVDSGGPYKRMIKDAESGAATFEFFAGLATEAKGTTIPFTADSINYTVREPLGVVVRINAYNHPFLFAAQRAAAPLVSGNVIVMKPPAQAPLSTLLFAELVGDLFPPGVFTVLPGGLECGQALVEHPKVAMVGLIGSVATGKAIARSAAGTLKKLSLELGGKNALIAFPDADPAKVAAGAVQGMNFTWCGQSCGSTSRVFLHESIYDEVIGHIVASVSKLTAGIPSDPDTDMGCLVSAEQLAKTERYVEYGKEDGATLIFGGKRPEDPRLSGGFFYLPTIFKDVSPSMRIAREEIFGPVMSIIRWSDEESLFQAVNESELGLTASIWTENLSTAHRAAARVEAGYIWVNGSSTHFLGAPFGGYKQSGLGREESIEELLACTQLKNVNIAF
ncbi:aldehyde dehydrogenase family protein [Mesorhizobium sp. M8A.F.Ca.ET.208.01.1.1]|uniref:aldehyde dehydrogenase family protein n=2 Tax=Mesorhizobium TaxID=68287 RepID=UPI001092600F|nr:MULTISPECIES: aldehyde dehydrogenase family protein [unclassified Mesorhizobium]TGU40083.1 aldehyde dehydrogenase family protein [bacterium M00.F.Ca.ET.156.01.1.1]TGV15126.1 aldehyde dehydrogenase family protein [Mesorhizobium sp. M8A.F.Ca.ET.173.01.1.1]TGQ89100.1 aldehyde dehydrogenase family protein [Mesorhizobium sp. M8A.F.Ca.ET.208.01.1.1]TGR32205.1 aldehyde dehydrogenase family protein [Mesorhizobium sp. M8A.F.Ca.ET.202.01.1.1]TGT50420.1 aldehyde dehydrogenase family protein [Mesorhizo